MSLVLLIACANVANLLLVRAISRRREIAIRAAIGAGRFRLIRQLLTESVLLSITGAVLGSALGIIGIRALLLVNTANLPRVGKDGSLVTVDWRVLAFTPLVTLVTSLLFGLIPALQSSRADLSATLKESSSRSGSGFRQNKARTLLIVSEIALAVVLLVRAALLIRILIRTSLALGSVKPGFAADHVLTMRMTLAGGRFVKSAAVDLLVRDGVERIRALPGVETASATCCIPLEGGYGLPFLIVGRPLDKGPFHGGGGWQTLSPFVIETPTSASIACTRYSHIGRQTFHCPIGWWISRSIFRWSTRASGSVGEAISLHSWPALRIPRSRGFGTLARTCPAGCTSGIRRRGAGIGRTSTPMRRL